MTETANLPVTQRAALALNSEAVEAEFRQLATQSQAIMAIVDDASYQECHGARMRLVKARTVTAKRGKDAREDAQAYAKGVIAEEKRLLGLIEPEERRLTALEDAHDQIERDRVQAEIERCTRISQAIQDLNMLPAQIAGKSVNEIFAQIAALRQNDVSTWAQDQTTAAQVAHGRALQALQQLHAGALAQEQAQAAEQAQIAQERAELAKLKAEQETRDREAAVRLADEERRQEESRAAARAVIEAEQVAARAQIHLSAVEAIKEAVSSEREACALLCEDMSGNEPSGHDGRFGALDCADAIRQRSMTDQHTSDIAVLKEDAMTYFVAPPPVIEELISHCTKWLALNLRAKVTITIDRGQHGCCTEEYDGRIPPEESNAMLSDADRRPLELKLGKGE